MLHKDLKLRVFLSRAKIIKNFIFIEISFLNLIYLFIFILFSPDNLKNAMYMHIRVVHLKNIHTIFRKGLSNQNTSVFMVSDCFALHLTHVKNKILKTIMSEKVFNEEHSLKIITVFV
jgi:hypothetical protein